MTATANFTPILARDLSWILDTDDPPEVSNLVNLHGTVLKAIEIDGTITSTSLALYGAYEVGDTVFPLIDSADNVLTITVASNRIVVVTAALQSLISNVQWLGVIQNAVEGAERTLRLLTGPPR